MATLEDDPFITPVSPSALHAEMPRCGEDLWRLVGNVGITLLIFEFGTQARGHH